MVHTFFQKDWKLGLDEGQNTWYSIKAVKQQRHRKQSIHSHPAVIGLAGVNSLVDISGNLFGFLCG